MRKRTILPALVLAIACTLRASAAENRGYGLSVIVDGSLAPEYASRGRIYIEALKGRTFTLRVVNPTGERVAVALSVDGRNVVDARHTAARAAAKWLLEPWQTLEIPGWQISGETSRKFFFTQTARSYAKWLGDTSNVGTIEAVFFREKRHRVTQRITVSGEAPRIHRLEADAEAAAGGSGPGGPDSPAQAPAAPREAARAEARPASEADRYAATGIGDRTSFPVQWVDFQEDPVPAASIALRYEFRPELARLGVLSDDGDLWARERALGFERRYAPSPER
jgi:hypothetical protein